MENEQTLHFSSWFKTNLIYYNVFAIITVLVFALGSKTDNLDIINWLSLAVITAISSLTPLEKQSKIRNLLVLSAFLLSSAVIIIFAILKPELGEEIYTPSLRIISSLIIGHARAFFIFLLASLISIFIFLSRFVWANRRNLNDMKWD